MKTSSSIVFMYILIFISVFGIMASLVAKEYYIQTYGRAEGTFGLTAHGGGQWIYKYYWPEGKEFIKESTFDNVIYFFSLSFLLSPVYMFMIFLLTMEMSLIDKQGGKYAKKT